MVSLHHILPVHNLRDRRVHLTLLKWKKNEKEPIFINGDNIGRKQHIIQSMFINSLKNDI
jgi:hypothetical protein